MANTTFSAAFTEILNAAVMQVIAGQLAAYDTKLEFLEERIMELQSENEELRKEIECLDIESVVERNLNAFMEEGVFKDAVCEVIENYDFNEEFNNYFRTDMIYESNDFDEAVKQVISEAMRG